MERNQDSLPTEMLINIFKYLNVGDRFAVGLTCQRWYEATRYQPFINDIRLEFREPIFGDTTSASCSLLESPRHFQNILFRTVSFNGAKPFLDRFGPHIREITFKDCTIGQRAFVRILKMVPDLRRLTIEHCRELFVSHRLLANELDQQILANNLQNVTTLSLANNRNLKDVQFERIVSLMPKLEDLDLSDCSIVSHEFDWLETSLARPMVASTSGLHYRYITQIIESRADRLKKLNFGSTCMDGHTLAKLVSFEALHLDALSLESCDRLPVDGIKGLVQAKSTLQHLDLSMLNTLTNACLHVVCQNLANLVSLKLRRCSALTDPGIMAVGQLRKLKILDISECWSITGRGIVKAIATQANYTLLELNVCAVNLCESAALKLADKFASLRLLELGHCSQSVSDLCLQIIFKNLIWLRNLNLDGCDKITDRGMTGIGMRQTVHNFEANMTAVATTPTEKNGQQQEPYNDNENSDYSIARLEGLQVLRLSKCSKLTDISLIHAFKLKELKKINLDKCPHISHLGIKHLVRNCPSLEAVDLSECLSITDEAIEMISTHLTRLRILKLLGCNQLTQTSLGYVFQNCQGLRVLDTRFCRNL